MKSLKQLLNTKAPPFSRLLDIAIVLSIVPHLFVVNFFMILYLLVALAFLFKKDSSDFDKYILMIVGLVLIGVAFFNDYNFADFSRMQFFVSLVSALLIYAVTLQRLTREINIYLKVSPVLLMLLSFFFFSSVSMLLYSIFTLFVFFLLAIWHKMDVELIEAIKKTAQLFILSLPAVVILFLVFPRISFVKTDFGFKSDIYKTSGYDGNMSVSSNEIRLSQKVVMEVSFKDANISENQLYFRGSTLYKQDGLNWKNLSKYRANDILVNKSNIVEYDITIHPHGKNWIYALDMPIKEAKKTELQSDYTLRSTKSIYERKRYRLHSALSYKLYSSVLSDALEVDVQRSEKTYKALANIKKLDVSSAQKALLLEKFFKDQNLSYTLKPKGTDLDDFTDSFLFESKNGYCVHFASAFAKSARMLDIPSRIVTGFKATKSNMTENYLLVKAADAHAWVELYFKERGWVRFDPTSTASQYLNDIENTQSRLKIQNTFFQRANLYFMHTKYIIDSWILDYNRLKQMSILNDLLNDTLYLIKFILSILGLIFLSFIVYTAIKRSDSKDELMQEMGKLLKFLKKQNIVKKDSESMEMFLLRAESSLGISLKKISDLYHNLKYAKNSDLLNLKELRDEIGKMLL